MGSKNDIANFVKNTDFDNKLKHVTSNKNGKYQITDQQKIWSTNLVFLIMFIFFRNVSKLFSIVNWIF